MTTFYKFQLPEHLERGVVGGPNFQTTVFPIDGGLEKRNIDWVQPVGGWDAGYGLLEKFRVDPDSMELDLDLLIRIFYTMQGRGYSFLLKDWADYEIGYRNGTQIAAQYFATGDGSEDTFQLFKRYSIDLLDLTTLDYDRTLTKFADNEKFKVYIDDVETSAFTMDYYTGIITMDSPPVLDEILTFRAEFFNHVRFDTDKLDVNMEVFNAGSWPSFPLIELLTTGV